MCQFLPIKFLIWRHFSAQKCFLLCASVFILGNFAAQTLSKSLSLLTFLEKILLLPGIRCNYLLYISALFCYAHTVCYNLLSRVKSLVVYFCAILPRTRFPNSPANPISLFYISAHFPAQTFFYLVWSRLLFYFMRSFAAHNYESPIPTPQDADASDIPNSSEEQDHTQEVP